MADHEPVLIGVPFYKNETLVEPVVNSLLSCASELLDLRAEVIFYNDLPDYPPLQTALDAALEGVIAFRCVSSSTARISVSCAR